MNSLNKIKLGCSPLTDQIFLYRHGKDTSLALDKREAEADVMRVVIDHMMHGAPNGSRKVVRFGEQKFEITVKPLVGEEGK